MSWTEGELINVMRPLFAQVEAQRESLTAAGVPQEAVGRALAGHAAKLLLGAQGPDLAREVFASLAEDMETAAAMAPGASESGGGGSTPPGGADPQAIMARAIRGAAARLGQQGIAQELVASLALATAAAIVAETFDREFASARLAELAFEEIEAPKRPRGHA